MNITRLENLVACLGRVLDREETRAKAEFAAKHDRKYDPSSDEDWDKIDKDYTGVETAMNLARAIHQIKSTVEFLEV